MNYSQMFNLKYILQFKSCLTKIYVQFQVSLVFRRSIHNCILCDSYISKFVCTFFVNFKSFYFVFKLKNALHK